MNGQIFCIVTDFLKIVLFVMPRLDVLPFISGNSTNPTDLVLLGRNDREN